MRSQEISVTIKLVSILVCSQVVRESMQAKEYSFVNNTETQVYVHATIRSG